MKKFLLGILILSALVGTGFCIRHVSGVLPETVEVSGVLPETVEKEVTPTIGFEKEETTLEEEEPLIEESNL